MSNEIYNEHKQNLDSPCCANCKRSWDQDEFPSGSIMSWAGFINDNNIFTYGLAGQFKLLSEKIFRENDYLCNICLKTMKYEEWLGVTCPYCKKQYQSYHSDCMGYGCSAEINNEYIEGNYGSKYDAMSANDRIIFIQERPSQFILKSNICDDCIDNLIKTGICQAPEPYDTTYCLPLTYSNPPTNKY